MKIKPYIIISVSVFTLIIAWYFFHQSKNNPIVKIQSAPKNTDSKEDKPSSFELKVIYSQELGWGFDIVKDNKPFIHQPNIPSIPGNKGFNTKEDAIKTGECMLDKLKRNIFPPSISIAELDSLNISGIQ